MSAEEKKNRSKSVNWIGIPFQMIATIFAGYWIGAWLDDRFEVLNKWWTIGLTLFAVLLSLYQLIKQIQRVDKNSK